jgi:hypothetical protein
MFALPFITYFVTVVLLMILARLYPRWDRALSVVLAVFVITLAGMRQGGIDYEEYVVMIGSLHREAQDSLTDYSVLAKDPLFGIIVFVAGALSDDQSLVFLVTSVLSITPKLLLSWTLARRNTFFLGLYCLLLAPGLEFAAIRAATGLGFLALAIVAFQSTKLRAVAFVLAIMSHLSFLAALVANFTVRPTWQVASLFAAVCATVAFLAFSNFGGLGLDRASAFTERGTNLAVVFPLFTLTLIAFTINLDEIEQDRLARPSIYASVILAIAFASFSLGSAYPMVVALVRLLEIGWFFLLYVLLAHQAAGSRLRSRVGLSVFVLFLISVNLYRETWPIYTWLDDLLY